MLSYCWTCDSCEEDRNENKSHDKQGSELTTQDRFVILWITSGLEWNHSLNLILICNLCHHSPSLFDIYLQSSWQIYSTWKNTHILHFKLLISHKVPVTNDMRHFHHHNLKFHSSCAVCQVKADCHLQACNVILNDSIVPGPTKIPTTTHNYTLPWLQ